LSDKKNRFFHFSAISAPFEPTFSIGVCLPRFLVSVYFMNNLNVRAVLGSRIKTFVLIAFAIGCMFYLLSFLWIPRVDNWVTDSPDFRAFSCAGEALRTGNDPYHIEPVRTCQRRMLSDAKLELNEKHILPAPLPPVALVPFGLISVLPTEQKVILWLTLLITSSVITILLISKIAQARLLYCALSILPFELVTSVTIGQLVPIVVLGAVLVAYSSISRNRVLLVLGLLGTIIEPHLALAVFLGTFLLIPNARKTILFTILGLGVFDLCLGPFLSMEYLLHILPEHAVSEISNKGAQYALSPVLFAIGFSQDASAKLGTLSYVVMLLIGLLLAKSLLDRNIAYASTTPLCAILIGGPFLHFHQMVAALPFAFLLANDTGVHRKMRFVCVIAILMLIIPWGTIEQSAWISDRSRTASYQSNILTTIPKDGISTQLVTKSMARPTDDIEIAYKRYIDENAPRIDGTNEISLLLWKFPTWLGLFLLLFIAAISGKEVQRES
jgi:hypothetical protein